MITPRTVQILWTLSVLCGLAVSCIPTMDGKRQPCPEGDVACSTTRAPQPAQHRVFAHVRECSDEKGSLRSADGTTAVQMDASEKHVFLRCVFHGGELEHCIAQNDCQVLMDAETCKQELAELQETYPDLGGELSCNALEKPAQQQESTAKTGLEAT